MSQLSQLEQQLQEMQQKVMEMKQEEKQMQESQYKGLNIKIKLVIGNKEFMTDAQTLLNKQYGITLFLEKYSKMDGNVNELCFARNPELFQYILDYLSGYDLQHQLRELKVIQLEKLQNDASYYKIKTLYDLIKLSLNCRFNPYMKSPLLELSEYGNVVTRSAKHQSLNQAIAIYGVMEGNCKRYIEFTVISHGSLYVKLGVTEAKPFRITRFPGRAGYPGCSLYGETGRLYRNGSTEPWTASKWNFGDRIGILVNLKKQNDTASIAFYQNGKLIKNKLNLKDYMVVNKGVVFVVALYTPNDAVHINQDAVIPQ